MAVVLNFAARKGYGQWPVMAGCWMGSAVYAPPGVHRGRRASSGRLRFVFYGRVSTEDSQDPVMSRVRQREQAEAVVRGHGVIVAEFFDGG